MSKPDEEFEVQAECMGGPLDGARVAFDGRASHVKFPRPCGGHFIYDVVRRKDGTIFLDWTFAPEF